MTETVYSAFHRVLQKRAAPKVEMMIDGYTGFLFLDKDGRPKVAPHLENYMRSVQKKYASLYSDIMPKVTPHVLRHTYCTNLQRAGLDVKSLQYLMGHSNVSVTLDIYTHSDYESVEAAVRRVVNDF